MSGTMHVLRMMILLIVLACYAFYASSEIIHYRPEYSAKKVTKGENRGNKVCFLESFWNTTGTRTLLTVSSEPDPYWGCLNESSQNELLGKMFQLHSFNVVEERAMKTGLMDALLLIHNGEEVMHAMSQTGNLTRSYLRYFDPKDFDVVHKTMTWLSRHLGKPPREGYEDFRNVLRALPLSLYHQIDLDTGHHCMSGAHAYMNVSSEGSAMSMCSNWDWKSAAWSLTNARCSMIGRSLTERNGYSWHSLGVTLTHELFHWGVLTETIPGRLIIGDRILNSSIVGGPCVAYGPWAAQELRRTEPWKAVTNADNYAIFLAEELLQRRCRTINGFSNGPYIGPRKIVSSARVAQDERYFSELGSQKDNGNSEIDEFAWIRVVYLIFGLILSLYCGLLLWIVWSGSRFSERMMIPNVGIHLLAHPQRDLGFARSSEYIIQDGFFVKRSEARLRRS